MPGDGTVFTPAYDDALTPSDDAYYNEIRYFYDCVRSGRKPDAVPLSDSAAAVSLALAVDGRVRLPRRRGGRCEPLREGGIWL